MRFIELCLSQPGSKFNESLRVIISTEEQHEIRDFDQISFLTIESIRKNVPDITLRKHLLMRLMNSTQTLCDETYDINLGVIFGGVSDPHSGKWYRESKRMSRGGEWLPYCRLAFF